MAVPSSKAEALDMIADLTARHETGVYVGEVEQRQEHAGFRGWYEKLLDVAEGIANLSPSNAYKTQALLDIARARAWTANDSLTSEARNKLFTYETTFGDATVLMLALANAVNAGLGSAATTAVLAANNQLAAHSASGVYVGGSTTPVPQHYPRRARRDLMLTLAQQVASELT